MKKIIQHLLPLPLLLSLLCCTDIKDVKYGDVLFSASFDALLSTDDLKLYENNLFELHMPDVSANGSYSINGDTIFLDYFKYEGESYQAFLMKQGVVIELVQINNRWSLANRDTDLVINTIVGNTIYKAEPKLTAFILVECDTITAQNFIEKYCGEKALQGVNGFNNRIIKKFPNWKSWYYPQPFNTSLIDRVEIGQTEDGFLILGLSFFGKALPNKMTDNIKRATILLNQLKNDYSYLSSYIQTEEYPYFKTNRPSTKREFRLYKEKNIANSVFKK